MPREPAAPLAGELKSESTALTLSLLSTLAPVALGIRVGLAGSDSGDGAADDIGAILVSSGLYFGPAVGVILGSSIYDIAKVKSHVRAANDEKARRAGAGISLVPRISPANGGTVGLMGRLSIRGP